MSDYVIETEGLYKVFGRKVFGRKAALNNLSLKLPRGGVHALVGSNGAGKSTLFRVLLGITSPTSGSSKVLGTDSGHLDPEIRGRIGLVNEEHTLPVWMTVRQLVAMQRSQYASWDEGAFREVIRHFNVLSEQKVGQLSRGERAGLNLAMAMAQSPELLILDEPTLGLDVVAKQVFLESLLFAADHDECTIIYCSHQMDEIERVAESLVVLERGHLASFSSLESFCGRISCWLLELDGGIPLDPIPGLLQSRKVDDLHQVVVLDQDERFREVLESLGARSVQRAPIGFDRAVNAYLNRNHHGTHQDRIH